MKTKVLVAVSCLLLALPGQAQKTEWVRSITDHAAQVSADHKVCTDSENNFYIMANFTDNIMFGADIVLKSKNKTGPTDAFIAKLDPEGEWVRWGAQITGFGNITANNICTDADMNVYVVGSFEDKTTFGESTVIEPRAKTGFFIAKYSPDGDFLWVKHGGNYYSAYPGSCKAYAVQPDADGSIVATFSVVGMYDDWKDDPSLPIEKRYLGKAYYEDVEITGDDFYTGGHTIVLKLSSDGDLIWNRFCGMGMGLIDLAVGHEGNYYLSGVFGGLSNFEGKEIKSNGLQDIIVLKLDSQGKTIWLKQFGSGEPWDPAAGATDIEFASFVDVDKAGNVYITGKFCDGARFDDITVESDAIQKDIDLGNVFLASLTPDGKARWVRTVSSKVSSSVTGLEADSEGNTYLYGWFSFKKGTFNGHSCRGPFVAKTDKDGNTEWIEDGKTREMSFTKTAKTQLTYPGGIALNGTEDRIYTTGNASKETVQSGVAVTTTTTETIIAITKIKIR
jgi:hypothetical protein